MSHGRSSRARPERRPAPAAARRRGRGLGWAALGYGLAAAYLSWPLPLHLAGRVRAGGPWGEADSDLIAWILAWGAHALATDPIHLFQANIFHPAPDALAFSEHLLGLAPVSAPLFLLTGSARLAANATTLAVVWLTALLCFVAVRAWTGRADAAFLAGAVLAFAPLTAFAWNRVHVSAIHLLAPILYLSWRAAERPSASVLLGLALATAAQALAGVYVAYELAVLLAAFAPAVVVEARRRGRSGVAPLLAAAAGGLALAPIAPPYLRARAAGAIADYAAGAPTFAFDPPRFLGVVLESLPWAVLALAALGLLAPRRAPVGLRLGLLSVAVLGVLFAFGPEGPGPYAWAERWVPGFSSMRAPTRFLALPIVAVSSLAGLGAAWLLERVPRPRAAAALALAASAAVVLARPLPSFDVAPGGLGQDEIALATFLADRGEGRPVLDLPADNSPFDAAALLGTTRAMVASTLHWLPLVNGYSGHTPPSDRLLMTLAQRLPDDPRALDAIRALADPGWIAVHVGRDPAAVRRWAAAEASLGVAPPRRFGQILLYRLPGRRGELRRRLLRQLARSDDGSTLAGRPRLPLERPTGSLTLARPLPAPLAAGRLVWVWVDVRNRGRHTWPGLSARPEGTVGLSARWRDPATGRTVAESAWYPLGVDLAPGESVRAQVAVLVPAPGRYDLEVGLVQPGSGWLHGPGLERVVSPARVVAAGAGRGSGRRRGTAGAGAGAAAR